MNVSKAISDMETVQFRFSEVKEVSWEEMLAEAIFSFCHVYVACFPLHTLCHSVPECFPLFLHGACIVYHLP